MRRSDSYSIVQVLYSNFSPPFALEARSFLTPRNRTLTSCLLEEKCLGFAFAYATGLEIYRAGINAILQPPEYHIHGAEEMDLDSESVGG